MKTILLTEYETIRQIYNTYMKQDFPASELKPLAMIRKARKQGRYDCYGMYEGDVLAGYAFFVKLPAVGKFHYLLDYLAVVDGNRNRGYGSQLLEQLANLISDASSMIAEVEDPDYAPDRKEKLERERRLRVYLRNGYRETGVTARVFGVDYLLLEVFATGPHPDEEIRGIYSEIYKGMVPAPMYQTFVKIRS
ncbi:MAG: GNAT family N-acetyltransferase [Parasporobacterium sp.]|nr:GNAT family N-acetyltransferase [Parasporobacterium sp.]